MLAVAVRILLSVSIPVVVFSLEPAVWVSVLEPVTLLVFSAASIPVLISFVLVVVYIKYTKEARRLYICSL